MTPIVHIFTHIHMHVEHTHTNTHAHMHARAHAHEVAPVPSRFLLQTGQKGHHYSSNDKHLNLSQRVMH